MPTLTEPQYKFIFSKSLFPAMIGGLGSGKSQAGTYRVAMLMLDDPGISCAYYFPTYDLINLRGIPGLIKDLDTLGITDYVLNKTAYTVTIKGFGDVIFRSYDSPERIVAYEVAHSIVDEIDTLTRDKAEFVWRKICERNRQPCNHEYGNTVGCVTTPDQGMLGFVYEKWGAADIQDGYELIKASTYSNPFLPDGYIENIRKNYNADLAELYLNGEFISINQRCVFDTKILTAANLECYSPKKRMVLETGRFIEHKDGELLVWDAPKAGSKYVIGADVAEGLVHGDYSSADVREVKTGYQVAHWHGHIAPDQFGVLLAALGKHYHKALLGVENNNHGLTVNINLRDSGYSNIYIQKSLDDRGSADKEKRKLGFTTTSKSKPYIIDQLSAELREGTHGIANKDTIKEMQTYIVDEKGGYNAISGCYDDRVMSYAISSEMLRMCPGHRK
jgi:hypothetical protein